MITINSFKIDIPKEKKYVLLERIIRNSNKNELRKKLKENNITKCSDVNTLFSWKMSDWNLEDKENELTDRNKKRTELFDRMLEALPIEEWMLYRASGNMNILESYIRSSGISKLELTVVINNNTEAVEDKETIEEEIESW
jgi:hypothetical protein